MFRRSAAEGGGRSRTKITSVVMGAWSIGARVAGVPEDIVDGGTGLLLGLIGYFLKGRGSR